MLSKLYENLMKQGRLRCGIAVFLLAFAYFDVAIIGVFFPQLCGDEQASVSFASPVKSTKKNADGLMAISNHGSQPSQDLSPPTIDEDCFCCCSHIIPGVCIDVAVLNGSSQPPDPTNTALPSSPPHDTFHPPRLS